MPEGPEVLRNSQALVQLIVGKPLDEVRLASGKLKRTGLGAEFKPSFVRAVDTRGKLIIIQLASGSALTSTLGMSGWWYPPQVSDSNVKAYKDGSLVSAADVVAQALKHARVELVSEGKVVAVFTDPRNFGNMTYHPAGFSEAQISQRIGLDLLNELPHRLGSPENAKQQLLKLKSGASKRLRNMRMGDLALEQSLIAGLGNIYRAETFWLTGIDPYARFGELDDNNWLKFCEVGMVVLQIAYATAGLMHYTPELIEACTGQRPLTAHRGLLAYGRSIDVFGRPIVRDSTFNRALWRLATL